MADGAFESTRLADGSSYETYFSGMAGNPALIVFTPVFGVDEDMITVADGWASEGFRVAVPDYYFRVQAGSLDRSEQGRAESMARWKKLDVSKAIEDIRPLAEKLKAEAGGALGAIGFCAGGELAFLAATRLGANSVSAFHATRVHTHLDELANSGASISLHYGDVDTLVPMTEVDQVKAAFKGNDKLSVHVYEGAQHGFSFEGRPSYNEAAATQSRSFASKQLSRLKTAFS